ncbi:hypothetical protein XENTR_v10011497 [Xenopus tropicalis]|nr:hypothetical protein XENTR_v10011497 [Xenopus tropicalis]
MESALQPKNYLLFSVEARKQFHSTKKGHAEPLKKPRGTILGIKPKVKSYSNENKCYELLHWYLYSISLRRKKFREI